MLFFGNWLTSGGSITAGGGGDPSISSGIFFGQGFLQAGGEVTMAGAVSFDGSGSFSGAGEVFMPGAVTFAGGGQLSGNGARNTPGAVAFDGDGFLQADGTKALPGSVTFDGNGTFFGCGTISVPSGVSFSGQGFLSGGGERDTFGAGQFDGAGNLQAAGEIFQPGAVTFDGAGLLQGAGEVNMQGAGTFAGAGLLQGAGGVNTPGAGTFAGQGFLQGDGVAFFDGVVTFDGAGLLQGEGERTIPGVGSFDGAGTLQAAGENVKDAMVTFTGSGTLFGCGNNTWNLNDASYNSVSYAMDVGVSAYAGIWVDPTETYLFGVDPVSDTIRRHTFGTPGSLATLGAVDQTQSIIAQSSGSQALAVDPTGTTTFILDSTTQAVYEYTHNANSLTGWSYTGRSFGVGGQDAAMVGMYVRPDGLKMYLSGAVTGRVFEYNLTNSWSFAGSPVYTGSFFTLPAAQNQPREIHISTDPCFDGVILLVSGSNNDRIYRNDMSTPWSISTASDTGQSFDISGQDGFHHGMWGTQNGLRFWTGGFNTGFLYEYDIDS